MFTVINWCQKGKCMVDIFHPWCWSWCSLEPISSRIVALIGLKWLNNGLKYTYFVSRSSVGNSWGGGEADGPAGADCASAVPRWGWPTTAVALAEGRAFGEPGLEPLPNPQRNTQPEDKGRRSRRCWSLCVPCHQWFRECHTQLQPHSYW